jgi:hypothetical protein
MCCGVEFRSFPDIAFYNQMLEVTRNLFSPFFELEIDLRDFSVLLTIMKYFVRFCN